MRRDLRFSISFAVPVRPNGIRNFSGEQHARNLSVLSLRYEVLTGISSPTCLYLAHYDLPQIEPRRSHHPYPRPAGPLFRLLPYRTQRLFDAPAAQDLWADPAPKHGHASSFKAYSRDSRGNHANTGSGSRVMRISRDESFSAAFHPRSLLSTLPRGEPPDRFGRPFLTPKHARKPLRRASH
jgi:hypothetical protein